MRRVGRRGKKSQKESKMGQGKADTAWGDLPFGKKKRTAYAKRPRTKRGGFSMGRGTRKQQRHKTENQLFGKGKTSVKKKKSWSR